MGYGALPVVRRMDKRQERRAGSVQNWDRYQFSVSPTCPPSTSIVLRGGLVWYAPSLVFGYGWYVPSYTVDLTDSSKTSSSYVFDHAYWYRACSIVPRTYANPGESLGPHEEWPDEIPDRSIYLYGIGGWYETVEEIEERLRRGERSGGQFTGPPTTAVILRNNGNTVLPNQYMPIDKVNRGRSYLFMNITPRWFTV